MSLNQAEKSEIIKKYERQPGDTGSPEVQIALLTTRITNSPTTCASTATMKARAAGCSNWSVSAVVCWPTFARKITIVSLPSLNHSIFGKSKQLPFLHGDPTAQNAPQAVQAACGQPLPRLLLH